MKTKRLTMHPQNMYCDRCLLNVMKALSVLDKIFAFEFNKESSIIKLVYSDSKLSKDKIKSLINMAITGEAQPALT